MSLAEWDGKYLIGVVEIDAHHQHLFNLIQQAFDDYSKGSSDQVVRTLLDELMEYASYHFASEEILMGEIGYPKLLEHSQEHTLFSDKVKEMMDLYEHVGSSILTSILIFLNAWLTQHILQKDRDYARYCKDHPQVPGRVATA